MHTLVHTHSLTLTCRFRCERDPLEVLESDPEIIYRALGSGQPFEPVFEDPTTGNYEAPQFNYAEKRTSWQEAIDNQRYNKAPGPMV